MKTTIDIPESLMQEAKRRAAEENTSFKALVEEGLRRVLAEREKSTGFKLRDASVGGNGLQEHLKDATWDEIMEMSYEGRGA
jgi:Arc/MetJ family transcription regulator